jgi:hypothetical protein
MSEDNMIQYGDIHSCVGFPQSPGKLDVRGTWRWISGRVVAGGISTRSFCRYEMTFVTVRESAW